MKKVLIGLLLAFGMLVVVSCSNDQTDPGQNDNPINEQPNNSNIDNNEQNGEGDVSDKEPVNPDNDNGEGNGKFKFDLTELRADDLQQGIITGLPFAIGDSFDKLQQQWGIPTDEDYLRGGMFHYYHVANYDFLFFDPTLDVITGIQINPKDSITLNQIREILGEATYDEFEDMLHQSWSLTYQYEDYTVFFIGKTEDENSDVQYMFLKEGH